MNYNIFCWKTTCLIIPFKDDHYVLNFDLTWGEKGIVWGLLFNINLAKISTLFLSKFITYHLILPTLKLDFIL
jgi:hypothetical protein